MTDFQKDALEGTRWDIRNDKKNDLEILTVLQHYGGKTNLIDFTEDYLIALFFACNGSDDKDGRVIFLKRESDVYDIIEPPRIIERVKSQKSIFVGSCTGIVEPEPEDVVSIPAALKRPMLHYLQKCHDISQESIYNDPDKRPIPPSAYGEHLNGLAAQRDTYEAKTPEDKDRYHKKAIGHYTEAIGLNPEFIKSLNNRSVSYRSIRKYKAAIRDCDEAIEKAPNFAYAYINKGLVYEEKRQFDTAIQNYNRAIEIAPQDAIAYNNRGIVYAKKKDFDAAIEDFNKAIALNSDYANAYNNRGTANAEKKELDAAIKDLTTAIDLDPEYANAYANRGQALLHLKDWEKAKDDLTAAKDMGADIVTSFHNNYKNVEDFEVERGVKVPEDIAALLSRD